MATVTVMMWVMATTTTTKVAGDKEGNGNGGKSNGDGNEGGRQVTATRAMAAVTAMAIAETLADPYKGNIPLARVNAFQEPFASCQVI